MKWMIGNVEIPNQIVVGPMAGISNAAFREIAHEFDAGLIFTEMISDKAIMYGNHKTLKMTELNPNEGIVAMQLFGNEITSLVYAAKYLDEHSSCAIIDINMGCPVPKIVNAGSGSALLKDVEYAYQLVSNIVEAVSKPVTVKIRIGWDFNTINAVEMAQAIEKAGAKAITVHGRVRSQYYEGKADWEMIKAVKQAVKIPVIGNGDIKSVADALKMLEITGCDAVMLARGILGDPWLIKDCVLALENTSQERTTTVSEKFTIARHHAQKLIALEGENLAMKEMRGHACWYIYQLPYNNRIKELFNHMTTYAQFDTILKNYETGIENNQWDWLFQ
jgi:nifR3 family TIM-barrel protein